MGQKQVSSHTSSKSSNASKLSHRWTLYPAIKEYMTEQSQTSKPKLLRQTAYTETVEIDWKLVDKFTQDLVFEFIDSDDYHFDPSEYEDYADRFVAANELILDHFPQLKFDILETATLYLLSKSA
jgi:hypothetical protein